VNNKYIINVIFVFLFYILIMFIFFILFSCFYLFGMQKQQILIYDCSFKILDFSDQKCFDFLNFYKKKIKVEKIKSTKGFENFILDGLKIVYLDPTKMTEGKDYFVDIKEINIFESNLENKCFFGALMEHIKENFFINFDEYRFKKNTGKFLFSKSMRSPGYYLYDFEDEIILGSVICDQKVFENNISNIEKNENIVLNFCIDENEEITDQILYRSELVDINYVYTNDEVNFCGIGKYILYSAMCDIFNKNKSKNIISISSIFDKSNDFYLRIGFDENSKKDSHIRIFTRENFEKLNLKCV
jgi:hypothetical protein